MTDVLSRYNTATQAYSNSVGSANEFQKSYNQEFYNDFLNENAAYKTAKATRDRYVAAAKDKAKASVAEAITKDKEDAARLIEGSGAALAGIEAVRGIRARMKARAAQKAENKGDQDQSGDGDAVESGDAEGTEGNTASMQTADDVGDDLVTPPASPRMSGESEEPANEATGPEAAEAPGESGSSVGGGEAADGADFGTLEGSQPYASSNPFGATSSAVEADVAETGAENASAMSSYTSALAEAGEGAGEAAGELAGAAGAAVGEAVGGAAAEEGAGLLAGLAGAGGEALATAAAVAPEAVALVGVGVGLYDLFHHHHHKQPPPDLTNAPPVPKAPTLSTAAQGATTDIANSRAEFTTPSFDSVTDVAGSISAF